MGVYVFIFDKRLLLFMFLNRRSRKKVISLCCVMKGCDILFGDHSVDSLGYVLFVGFVFLFETELETLFG